MRWLLTRLQGAPNPGPIGYKVLLASKGLMSPPYGGPIRNVPQPPEWSSGDHQDRLLEGLAEKVILRPEQVWVRWDIPFPRYTQHTWEQGQLWPCCPMGSLVVNHKSVIRTLELKCGLGTPTLLTALCLRTKDQVLVACSAGSAPATQASFMLQHASSILPRVLCTW